ncbi:DUF805 domain-containing protein [uncultured Megamonas sp.]|uniref:DUF805 domain-containing protein n=1 Tax=uncultured Megamonas sp. TaxID=286140 RepID=UPI0025E96A1B|nr:DUF805 domain-containing protein [uncultured Megamonas sp.]
MKNISLEERFLSTKGRINRKIFILYAISFILFCLFLIIPTLLIVISTTDETIVDISASIVSTLIELALLPSLFLGIKRLHDLDKSAVWIVLYVIPLINILFFIYLCLRRGTIGDNKYGKDPLTLDL